MVDGDSAANGKCRLNCKTEKDCQEGGFWAEVWVMKPWMRVLGALAAFALVTAGYAHGVSEDMVDAAKAFLSALNDGQKAKAQFDLKDDERLNWHFVPKARKGLSIKEMEPHQRSLALGL